jgi:hypothetical protein
MTRYTPLWEQAGSYAASIDRRLIAAVWPPAAVTGCAVTAQAGTMLVNVAAGAVAVPSQNSTGSTLCVSDAVEQVAIGAASGQNRIDLVICRPRGTDLDGGTNNDFIFDTVAGVPAASPAPPATPAGTVLLAQILVPTGSVAVTQPNITDTRPALLNPAGEPPTTSASLVTRTDTLGEVWIAKSGVNSGLWRKARDVLSARLWRNAAFSITAGDVGFSFDNISYDAFAMYSAGVFTVPIAGLYRMSGVLAANGTAAGQWYYATINQNGTARARNSAQAGAAGGIYAGVSDQLRCAAGDQITLSHRASVALSGLPSECNTNFSIAYVGTG